MIIFTEAGVDLSPLIIQSQFIQNYYFVQPVQVPNCGDCYRLSVATKEAIQRFGPPLPIDGLFKVCSSFRPWLLTKILNGERMARASSVFQVTNQKATREFLQKILDANEENRTFNPEPLRMQGIQKFSATDLDDHTLPFTVLTPEKALSINLLMDIRLSEIQERLQTYFPMIDTSQWTIKIGTKPILNQERTLNDYKKDLKKTKFQLFYSP